jgi:type I protein arginine methyltransferase
VHAFLLYFDTFFTSTGDAVPSYVSAHAIKEGDAVLAEMWPVGGRSGPQRRQSIAEGLKSERMDSFSTGPASVPTHWKQTIFLLREPVVVVEGPLIVRQSLFVLTTGRFNAGTIVSGSFHCRKSESNPRELAVEIHYSVRDPGMEDRSSEDLVVQMFNIR